MNTLQELEDIYNNEIRKDQTKTLQERYWIIVELQTKLKENFQYYDEYELFRIVLQNYYNGLQKLMKSKSSRFKQFKTSSSSSSTNKESIVYNTPSSNRKPISSSYRNRSLRFGEPSVGPSLLKQSDKDRMKSKSSRLKQFNISSSSSLSRNKKSIVHNTPSFNRKPLSSSHRNRSLRFGEPSAGPSLLKQSDKDTLLHSLDQEIYYSFKLRKKNKEYKINYDVDFFFIE